MKNKKITHMKQFRIISFIPDDGLFYVYKVQRIRRILWWVIIWGTDVSGQLHNFIEDATNEAVQFAANDLDFDDWWDIRQDQHAARERFEYLRK